MFLTKSYIMRKIKSYIIYVKLFSKKVPLYPLEYKNLIGGKNDRIREKTQS